MPTIRINGETLKGGIKSQFAFNSNSQEASETQYVESFCTDLHRIGLEGHITSCQTFSIAGVSNAEINSMPRSIVVDTTYLVANPRIYYLTSGLSGTAPRIIKTTFPGTYVSNTYLTAHGGANFTTLPSNLPYWGEDIITYKVGATNYLFYSWNDNTYGDVGRCAMDMTSQDDDYMATVPAGNTYLVAGVPHRMAEGADGKLYITNGRYVSQFDGGNGANGTLDATRYDLGVGWISTDVRRYGNFLAISSVRVGGTYSNYSHYTQSQVTLWNMTEPNLGLVYPVSDNFITAIFYAPNGGLYAFTVGRNETTKVFKFTGQDFRKIWESAVTSVSPDPRGITVYKNLMCWVSGYRVVALDLDTDGVHAPFALHDGDNAFTSTGAFIFSPSLSYLMVGGIGGVSGTTYKTFQLTTNSAGYYSVTSTYGLKTRIYRLPYNSTIKKVKVWVSQIASGGSATLSLFKNYTNTSVGTSGADMLNKTISYTTDGAITEKEWAVGIPKVSSFYMNIKIAGQISIAQIEIDYEERK